MTDGLADFSAEAIRALAELEIRVEGALKVTGRARYTADLRLPDMLHVRFLLSPLPHARIVSIDTSSAAAAPGVRAVLTSSDIGLRRFGRHVFDWPVLAHERVRFVGERVAAVAAESADAAEEAVHLIRVQYDELPAVLDPEQALSADAPVLHPDRSDYYVIGGVHPPVPHRNVQAHQLVSKGDPEIARAMARAHHVFEDVYFVPRAHQGYLEPHACLVWIQPDGTVRVISTNKMPFALRQQLSVVTGLPAERIVVDSRFIGGDFGGKGQSIDEFACYYLAVATGRPVAAVMSYTEELLATNPRHSGRLSLRTGVTSDGRIVAHETRAVFDGGAYLGARPGGRTLAAAATLEVYSVPHVRAESVLVYTNTVPAGNMRAPGGVHAALAGEGHVDHMARALGIDPLEFRLRNALREGDTGPAGERIRNPRAIAVLEALRAETRWEQGSPRPNHGRGLALRRRGVGEGKTELLYRLLPGGYVEVLLGVPDQGGGSHTAVRRIAAAALSVRPDRVVPRYGTTAEAFRDAGAGGSRVTRSVGLAAVEGAQALKARLESLAAEVMGWPSGQVRLEQDRFLAGDGSGASASFEAVAARVLGLGPLEIRAGFDPEREARGAARDCDFVACMVEVEVDPETGQVRPVDAVMAVDVGTIINPLGHQGQLEGGFVFGLGSSLMEELRIEDGKVTTLNLADYKLPSPMDVPPLRTVLVPTGIGPGPFGAKAVGELVNSAVAPAVANAVYDAVSVRLMMVPTTAERVFTALKEQADHLTAERLVEAGKKF